MLYNPITSAAAATANQALIVLLDTLNELVEQVLCSQSEEDKMRLSCTIAFQLNNAVRSHLTLATYIPLRLLSMAAEVHRAQRGTAQLVQVPDWSQVEINEDICQGHPLYSKTLGLSPTVTIPAGSSSAPALAGSSSAPILAGPSSVPQPAGSSAPAPAQTSAPPIATLPVPSIVIKISGGAISGSSKHRKRQFSVSPPRPVKRARKIVKSKRILSDTDTDSDGVHIEKGHDQVKGKGKARVKLPSSDDNTQEITMKDATRVPEVKPWQLTQNPLKQKIPVVNIRTQPMPPSNTRNKGADHAEYQPEEDVESIDDKRKPHLDRVKDTKPSMSDTRHVGTDKDKKGKHPQPVRHPVITIRTAHTHPSQQPIECHSWLTKKGLVAHTCARCNRWRMKCIWPTQLDAPAITMPIPLVAPITTHSKATRVAKQAKQSRQRKGKSVMSGCVPTKSFFVIDTQQPSPIPEGPDADVEMLNDAPTVPSAAPVLSNDNFPKNHYIETMDDSVLPPTPFEETPDEVQYTPIYPASTQRPPSPATTSMPIQSHQPPHHLSNAEIETMLAQIQIDMEELRTHDDAIHNDLSRRIDELCANYIEQFGLQKGLVDQLTFQVGEMVRYLRDNHRAAASLVTTLPTFNPPPIVIPGTPIFPEFGSISALGRAVTNNIFTLDVFLTGACPTGDGSPVTRREQAPTSSSTSTINPAPTIRASSLPIQLAVALPVPTHTVPMESMPSTSTIRMLVTRSPNVPEDDRPVNAFKMHWTIGMSDDQITLDVPDDTLVRSIHPVMDLVDDGIDRMSGFIGFF
ncbi:uncharacterized protein HD556DRAFT_1314598 [Suillus plorans]|uniref:Uncharacterized protein n=1 Tax=Suillus plorans TaxID=116603 RepID=A0A9P7A9N8_9AGAM|nr:uncharacterized protein HD556DRAFT_1314598 [Suillus plorans]KAG1784987.1 hypothetical protein HD556DRAFT_1314598 [Suillus plorans]